MSTHSQKAQENKSQGASIADSQIKNDKPAFQFIDNRAETTYQRKIQEAANNSPQVRQLKAFQNMVDKKVLNAVDQNSQSVIQQMPDKTNFPKNIHEGQQSKHDDTSQNYINLSAQGTYKSFMKPARAQQLLTKFHNTIPDGENPVPKEKMPESVVLENESKKRVVVEFGEYVGTVVDENTGENITASTKGAISYGAKPHMYPTE